jgi:hypothetical protein
MDKEANSRATMWLYQQARVEMLLFWSVGMQIFSSFYVIVFVFV